MYSARTLRGPRAQRGMLVLDPSVAAFRALGVLVVVDMSANSQARWNKIIYLPNVDNRLSRVIYLIFRWGICWMFFYHWPFLEFYFVRKANGCFITVRRTDIVLMNSCSNITYHLRELQIEENVEIQSRLPQTWENDVDVLFSGLNCIWSTRPISDSHIWGVIFFLIIQCIWHSIINPNVPKYTL
jgi:hypothetical protein